MTYPEILQWAKRGISAEIDMQNQMLQDAQKYDTPSAPALRELLANNIGGLQAQLDHVEDLLQDPTGLGR